MAPEHIKQAVRRSEFDRALRWLGAAAIAGGIPSLTSFAVSGDPVFSASNFPLPTNLDVPAFGLLAIPCGALAVVLALVALERGWRLKSRPLAGVSTGLVLFGLMQMARGLG